MRTVFSFFFVRLIIYTAIITLILLFKFPQLLEEKKIKTTKKPPSSVKVTLVAPKKPKKIKKIKPKKKVKPKKIIKPKPKPKPKKKKIVKPKPKPKPKPIPKTIVKEINTTKVIKKEIKKIEPKPIFIPEPEYIEIQEPEEETLSVEEENEIQLYEEYLRDTIYSKKKYPTRARRMRHQGSVEMMFIIDRNGKIVKYEIVNSSKYSTLNKATMRLFEKIDKFDTPPEKLQTPYEFKITLQYKLK